MKTDGFQIRSCANCGLRFPLVEIGIINPRCPACLGMTKLELEKAYSIKIAREQSHPLPEKYNVVGLLDNIRSGLIIGSIIRCADGLGVKRIYCYGITPTPD